MDTQQQQKLLECYKHDKEMQRLILEIENRKDEKTGYIYTHYIIPSFVAGAAIVLAFAHVAKLIITA